ncbi:MAG TPA: pyruvate kinase [Polyangiaceae bacterium]|nr:pyruvate kinase [Polyangiaceae bacterium]
MAVRRAKIVCTLGPAVDGPGAIRKLIEAGMNVARLNFSHGSHAEHRARAERVRGESAELGIPVAILQDLCGPKLRTGNEGPALLETGAEVGLVGQGAGDEHTLSIDYPALADEVHPGDRIVLSDGQIQLSVRTIENRRVRCHVDHGGKLRARMGVNLPSHRMKVAALTDKDRVDLDYGLSLGVDYVALSFVRAARDVEELRELCAQKGYRTPIVAKIETPAAVKDLNAIVQAADAVMVARGDLGVELAPEQVPVVQRQILGACRELKKPAIVATEMLHSMIESPLPTRAEASDVAGAVFGGADAVMLSAETATGAYAIAACKMMDRIIRAAESSAFFDPRPSPPGDSSPEALAGAACEVAARVGARLIVALTASGGTARLVSKARPGVPVIALSFEESTLRRLALLWGVEPRTLAIESDLEKLVADTRRHLTESGRLSKGDCFVLVYGAPLGAGGATNAVRVETA